MIEPETVVKQIEHALKSKYPRSRYYSSLFSKMIIYLKNTLFESILDSLIAKLSFKNKSNHQ